MCEQKFVHPRPIAFIISQHLLTDLFPLSHTSLLRSSSTRWWSMTVELVIIHSFIHLFEHPSIYLPTHLCIFSSIHLPSIQKSSEISNVGILRKLQFQFIPPGLSQSHSSGQDTPVLPLSPHRVFMGLMIIMLDQIWVPVKGRHQSPWERTVRWTYSGVMVRGCTVHTFTEGCVVLMTEILFKWGCLR